MATERFDQKEIQRLVVGVPTKTEGGLQGDIDVFNGVTVKTHHFNDIGDAESFKEKLIASLRTWELEGRRGIWMQVPTEKAEMIPIATKILSLMAKLLSSDSLGFDFHHAQPGYAMLTKWLPKDEPNKLPHYANHYVGVGGFVLNDKNDLLVIQEKYLTSLKRPIWKIPGGMADPGENIAETAIREVKEETGIETEFVSLLCFRHMHQFRWGNSDFFFICLLKPLTIDVVIDRSEISEYKWIKLEEYIADPDTLEINRLIAQSFLSSRDHGCSMSPTFTPHYRKGFKDLVLYSVKPMTADFNKREEPDTTFQPKL